MLLLSLFLVLIIGEGRGDGVTTNITFLNQTNVYQRYPDLRNKMQCQNMTDKWGFPTFEAADDATLPTLSFLQERGVKGGLDECSALTFSWTTIRTRHDTAPNFITLSFWRDMSYNATPFYKKSFLWPTNNAHWVNDPLGMPWQSEITLQLNELGDDGLTRFNFRDKGFFPIPGETFWISFYANMRYGKSTNLRTNAMYWVLLNTDDGSTPIQEIFLGGRANSNFMYRDLTNFLGNGWVNWTDGLVVEDAMKISTAHNLAFTLSFTCLVTPTPPPTTPPPTQTTPISVQTESPSLIIWGNETNMTEVEGGSGRVVASILAPLLTLCLCGGFMAFLARRWKQRKDRKSLLPITSTDPDAVNPIIPENKEVSLFDSIEDIPIDVGRNSSPTFSDSYGGMRRGNLMVDSSISSDED